MSTKVLRIVAGVLICFLVMYFALRPLEYPVNYVVLGWGTRYWWPIAIYAGAALLLFIVLGFALGVTAGIRVKLIPLSAAFGFGCMLVLMYRQPFLSLTPSPPTWGELVMAYAHTVMAPIGAVLGAILASKILNRRRAKGATT